MAEGIQCESDECRRINVSFLPSSYFAPNCYIAWISWGTWVIVRLQNPFQLNRPQSQQFEIAISMNPYIQTYKDKVHKLYLYLHNHMNFDALCGIKFILSISCIAITLNRGHGTLSLGMMHWWLIVLYLWLQILQCIRAKFLNPNTSVHNNILSFNVVRSSSSPRL